MMLQKLTSKGPKLLVSCAPALLRAHKETSVRMRLVASKAAYDAAKAMKQPVDTSSVYGHTRVGAAAVMLRFCHSVMCSMHDVQDVVVP